MADEHAQGGHLAERIVEFAGLLRRAGMRVGPALVTDAIEAVLAVGLARRDDFYWALHAVFAKRHEDHATFDEAFHAFWRSRLPGLATSPTDPARGDKRQRPAATRVAHALSGEGQGPETVEIAANLSWSAREALRRKDFAQMSAEELAEARRAIAALAMPDDSKRSRRTVADPHGRRADPRAVMRLAMRTGGDLLLPRWRSPRQVERPLVLLIDISGSMSAYSRIFLHFAHALMAARRHVHVFTFSTRLTNITRSLRLRDPDEALARCADLVPDWSGGTRIGEALHLFNRLWSRRVLGQGASVLLMTDGLERDRIEVLVAEMARLRRSCHRLVWLNPLLRFDGFEPRARGIAAMLPHVDAFRPVHSLDAMADLCALLSAPSSRTRFESGARRAA